VPESATFQLAPCCSIVSVASVFRRAAKAPHAELEGCLYRKTTGMCSCDQLLAIGTSRAEAEVKE
jgi:hypothetical protein